MKPASKIEMTPAALVHLRFNPTQCDALIMNVVTEGRWETADRIKVWMDFTTVMVVPLDGDTELITLGIEPDGYTHS
jgi:hypothetical protein